MTYSFQPFLDDLDTNWFEDDELLQRLLDRHADPYRYSEGELRSWGEAVAGPLRERAERSARPENRPRLRRHDPYGRRIDEVVLPESTREAFAEVHGREGLGAPHGDPYVFYAKNYLYAQNGEAGVVCSQGCTDGMVRVLEALGDRPEHAEAVERIRGSSPERVWHGAQFVTEIQGGSDVPANRVEARPDGDAFRIHGRKWFCSNVGADYFLVSAQPAGAPDGGRGPGLFLVPARREPGAAERNGYTIDRLKDKLGTRELATAEVTFDGALARPVGPLEEGLSNLVRHVLVTSRFYCVYWAASALRRAERIAGAYAEFRTAFGRPIAEFPLVEEALAEIREARARALAATFELLRLWERAREAPDGPEAVDFRILLSLCKPVLTRRATRLLHEAMTILGGNGIEERFSPLPRLYRDAVIMETWEGPHNVLLTQALRDLRRFEVDPTAFLPRVAGERGSSLVPETVTALQGSGGDDPTVSLGRLAPRLVRAFSDRALNESA